MKKLGFIILIISIFTACCCWRLATIDFSNISFELSIKDLFELQKQF